MRHFVQSMKWFFQNHNDIGGIPLLELHQMDVGEISSNEDLYEKVYIHDMTKWFLLWKEKNIQIPYDEIRIVVSKVLWEQRKFWVLSKAQDDKLQICKVQNWEIPFPAKFKEGYYDL